MIQCDSVSGMSGGPADDALDSCRLLGVKKNEQICGSGKPSGQALLQFVSASLRALPIAKAEAEEAEATLGQAVPKKHHCDSAAMCCMHSTM